MHLIGPKIPNKGKQNTFRVPMEGCNAFILNEFVTMFIKISISWDEAEASDGRLHQSQVEVNQKPSHPYDGGLINATRRRHHVYGDQLVFWCGTYASMIRLNECKPIKQTVPGTRMTWDRVYSAFKVKLKPILYIRTVLFKFLIRMAITLTTTRSSRSIPPDKIQINKHVRTCAEPNGINAVNRECVFA